MNVFVSGGRSGAIQAAQRRRVAIDVDALRAGATTASLFHYGVREIIVVEDVEAGFSERERHPGSWLAGERGGLAVPGFDLGNSPLQGPLAALPEIIVFSSSNMSRCCVGAASCPATLLGTLPTLTACAQLALQTAAHLQADIQLVPAGSALDENKLVLEDYITCGALIEQMIRETHQRDGVTVVLVTHNIFQAKRLATRAMLLLDGELIEEGEASQFFGAPRDPRTARFLAGEMTY